MGVSRLETLFLGWRTLPLGTRNVTLVVADASTFSAIHSDVSHAAPDSGYTWSETDTTEITGMATQHDSWVYTASRHSGRLLHLVSICCMCLQSMLAWVIQLGICWPWMCWIDTICKYVMCLSGVYMPSACHMKDFGVCGIKEHRAGLFVCACVRETHCEGITLHIAFVFTGLGLVGQNMWPITTMEMCAFPSEVHYGNTNGFYNILL